jgi:tRNA(adenine34) deaminase
MLVEELLNEKEWSQAVTDGPARTFAKKGIHTKKAEEIVAEYKRKGVSPKGLGSAIRMLQFYINRAGKNLHNGPEIKKAIKMLQADLAKEHAKAEKKKD